MFCTFLGRANDLMEPSYRRCNNCGKPPSKTASHHGCSGLRNVLNWCTAAFYADSEFYLFGKVQVP